MKGPAAFEHGGGGVDVDDGDVFGTGCGHNHLGSLRIRRTGRLREGYDDFAGLGIAGRRGQGDDGRPIVAGCDASGCRRHVDSDDGLTLSGGRASFRVCPGDFLGDSDDWTR